jgi:acylphosphatase
MSQLHVRLSGLVQGVGFRWFVREKARRLGLSGWVRNLPDGSVEVLASGEESQLELLKEQLRVGPPGAVVDGLTHLAGTPEQPLATPFGIIKG